MRAMWFGTRSSSRSLRPISITSPGTRQRHHPTVDMGYRTRYLQMAARMRARFSKTYSPGSWASSSSTWMRAMWFGTRSSSRSLRPISITSPGTRQRHHPTVDMGYRTRYLQMAARMRARFSKTSVSFRRRLVAAVMFVFLVVIMSIEISPFGYLVEVGKPSKRTIIAPRTVQYVDKVKTSEQQDAAAAAVQEVFSYNSSVVRAVESNLENLFRVLEETDSLQLGRQEIIDRINQNIAKKLPSSVVGSLLDLSPAQRRQVHDVAFLAIDSVMKEDVTEDNLEEEVIKARRSADVSQQNAALKSVTGELVALLVQPNTPVSYTHLTLPT